MTKPGSQWSYSPLYEEIVHLPSLLRAPGVPPGNYTGITSAVDVYAHGFGPAGTGDS